MLPSKYSLINYIYIYIYIYWHFEPWSILLFWRSIFWSQNRPCKDTHKPTLKIEPNCHNHTLWQVLTYHQRYKQWRYDKHKKKFHTLQETSESHTPNDEYENFVTAHMEAAAECIPTKWKVKIRVPLESLVVRKKRYSLNKASLLKK